MPVQINEVIVKTVVGPYASSSGNATPTCSPSGNSGTLPDTTEAILQILKEKKER